MRAVLPLLLFSGLLSGCHQDDGRPKLQAKIIQRQDELIGGPTAKGKLGDILMENDQIRVIISNIGPSYSAGIFGGTITDIDRHRWRSGERSGMGWDHFAESFPLANLLVVNPASPRLGLEDEGGYQLKPVGEAETVRIVKDGSDGEVIVRVEGHSGYMFDTLKFLNQGFLRGFLADLNMEDVPLVGTLNFASLHNLIKIFLQADLLGILNRLQIDFDFSTDYILHQGESHLTIRTRIILTPPDEKRLADCPPLECELDCSEQGYVLAEMKRELSSFEQEGLALCPICECAEAQGEMPTFGESADIFKLMLGDAESWKKSSWKAGIVAGDFLFFGGNSDIFSPGLGFDYDRKIFGNMWDGVGTLGSPFALPWIGSRGENVSYAMTSRNPQIRQGADCPEYRLSVLGVNPEGELDLAEGLKEHYGYSKGLADALARTLIVDHKPIPIQGFETPGGDFQVWYDSLLESPEAQAMRDNLGEVELGILPQASCRPSKLLIPIFTTSATASLSHFSEGEEMVQGEDGLWQDRIRSYTFERYLLVGDGDIGSLLEGVYTLRGQSYGYVKGLVLEEGSLEPIHHADIFLLKDPRQGDEALPESFSEYLRLALERWGDAGILSQMQSDLGLDPIHDGDYSGPIEPGRYLIMAHLRERGQSELVPVEIKAGETEIVHLSLPPAGEICYRISDNHGQLLPGLLSFIPLNDQGQPLSWEGSNQPALGDPRWDEGISFQTHSADGEGCFKLPSGSYHAFASRGFEYSRQIFSDLQVRAGQSESLDVVLIQEVNTRGWLSGDFHIHQSPSTDSGLSLFTRLSAAAAVGLEVLIATDHDHVTDFLPYIFKMGMEHLVATQVGVETSPLEYGHTNAWPLKYDDRRGHSHDPPPWAGRSMSDIWGEMRTRAAEDPEAFVLQTNHSRDGFLGYFSQIGLKGYNLERVTPGMEMCSEALAESPCDFDAMEIFNGKHFEYLWTPTIWEARSFNTCYTEISETKSPQELDGVCEELKSEPEGCADIQARLDFPDLSDAERTKASRLRDHCGWHLRFKAEMGRGSGLPLFKGKRLSLEALKELSIRYMLERTPEELKAYRETTPETDLGCSLEKAIAGCEAVPDDTGAYEAGCGGEDCGCESCVCQHRPECCITAEEGGTGWTRTCADLCRGACTGCGVQPCTDRFEMMDDWFAFLNMGMNVTATGNSDSHSTKNQVGFPRTYVKVETDRPADADMREFNVNLNKHRAVVSSGPFIDFKIITDQGEGGIGDTVMSGGGSTPSPCGRPPRGANPGTPAGGDARRRSSPGCRTWSR